MKNTANKKIMAALALSATLTLPTAAMARVSGACANCHTMHNSQDGTTMSDTSTVYRALTQNGCVGCHTSPDGTNTGSSDTIPYVNHNSAPTDLTTLAGGSFYWVKTDDSKGHNVLGITTDDDALLDSTPPGMVAGTFTTTARLTCAGTNGCHGVKGDADPFTDISGAHHGENTSSTAQAGYVDGTDIASSFRFLNGIIGIEDSDWENDVAVGAHNQYSGAVRTADTDNVTSTISSLCGQCHGNFHTASSTHQSSPGVGTENGISYGVTMSSPWVRHPTDFDMYTVRTKEYGSYGGGTDGVGSAYVPDAPVASTAALVLSDGVLSSVLQKPGDAIVTCISCHRAHGSPYADMLRWDTYDAAVTTPTTHTGTAGNTGCYICHTTKDDA